VLGHLSDAQCRALVIADNQLAITGASWNEEMLRLELKVLQEETSMSACLGSTTMNWLACCVTSTLVKGSRMRMRA